MHLEGWLQKRGWPHIFSMPQHCFVAKQLNTTLFCRETLKYGTFWRKVKIRYFLSRNVKIRTMSQKNVINCVPSQLRILISPVLYLVRSWNHEKGSDASRPPQPSLTRCTRPFEFEVRKELVKEAPWGHQASLSKIGVQTTRRARMHLVKYSIV